MTISPDDRPARSSDAPLQDEGLACLVLAAGLGTRMRPFTDHVPKPLLTVDNEPLLARSLRLARRFTYAVAVNSHHLADQVERFVEPWGVRVSHEERLLGTAGAVGNLAAWLDGRDVLILNSDTWLEYIPDDFVAGWDRRSARLLVREVGRPSDFGTRRFVGASLLPGGVAASLPAEPAGLYETVWAPAGERLQLVETDARAFDCGTPDEFIRANLEVSGAKAVVHPTARPGGPVVGSVFLEGATSPPGVASVGEIRDRFGNVYVADPVQGTVGAA
ncbi:nucleotidyltransferase family protein [Tessaracoccus oleiagri]|uniref:MobA-like NTP transferase domain-containing protein n=1 Tax=Tessaracoccus oleiagri TaxID=686624 RepID=A0A1G9JD16_9ACTN|nr:NTP transferase domain-containing protein [Tessaracoccus oleiagri]SDL35281.1 MobA-like NTP transferase domain-containing protein [Tessaracoccus oleiagri]